jgi:hypothetical protein
MKLFKPRKRKRYYLAVLVEHWHSTRNDYSNKREALATARFYLKKPEVKEVRILVEYSQRYHHLRLTK